MRYVGEYVVEYDPSRQEETTYEESYEEVSEQEAHEELRAHGFELPPGPRPPRLTASKEKQASIPQEGDEQHTSPIICSQAAIARFLNRSQNTTGLITKLKEEGIIAEFVPPARQGGKYTVWFSNLAQHKQALQEISGKPPRRKAKRREP